MGSQRGQWDSSKSNRIWSLFCLEKQLIITKLVRNQMVGQIFDKFWEIKSAKCCWHLATEPIGGSWTWQKSQSPNLSAVETSNTVQKWLSLYSTLWRSMCPALKPFARQQKARPCLRWTKTWAEGLNSPVSEPPWSHREILGLSFQ